MSQQQPQQPGKSQGSAKSPADKLNRAFESATQGFWNLGLKLAGLEHPLFRIMGVGMLNQMAEPASKQAAKATGYPEKGFQGAQFGIHDPNLAPELLDRYERNQNSAQLPLLSFLYHFNKNRKNRKNPPQVTATGLRQLLSNMEGGPPPVSPGIEYRPNPELSA